MINCAHNLSYVSRAEAVSGPSVLMVPFFLCDKLKLFVTGHMDVGLMIALSGLLCSWM